MQSKNDNQNLLTHPHTGAWTLISFDGEKQLKDVQLPYLQVLPKEKRVHGNDGCNQFFGEIELMDHESIIFGQLAGTRKMCLPMDIPNQFNEALRRARIYKLEDQNLHLMDEEGYLLGVLKKSLSKMN